MNNISTPFINQRDPLSDDKQFAPKERSFAGQLMGVVGGAFDSLERTLNSHNVFSQMRDSSEKNPVHPQKAYNPYKVPPDWSMAEDHRQAVRIAKPILPHDDEPISIDEMSGRPIHNKQLSLFCHRRKLNFLGPSFPLFFQFYHFTFGILIVFLAVYGVFAIFSNSLGDFCIFDPTEEDVLNHNVCPNYLALRLSLANKISHERRALLLHEFMGLLAFIAVIALLHYCRYLQRKEAQACDDGEWTAADFTLEVKNIPAPEYDELNVREEVHNWFREHARPGQITEVANVSLAYDVSDIVQLKNQIAERLKRRRKIMANDQADASDGLEIEQIEREIKAIQEDVKAHEKEFAKGQGANFLGIAYVSLNRYTDCLEVRENFKKDLFCLN